MMSEMNWGCEMKVVYIADIGIEGGATKSLLELVGAMKSEYGIDTVVLTSGRNQLNQLLTKQNIENYAVGHGAFLQGAPDAIWKKIVKYIIYGIYYYTHFKSSIKKALRIIDWNTVDLIHTNVARDDLGMELSKMTGIPNICHIREFAELDFNCWSYRTHYVRYLAEHTDGFIAISESVKTYWVKKGLPERKIDVIYNGVDREKIIHVDHCSWHNDNPLKMVIVGGIIANKGQWQAIEAICQLPDDIRKNVRLDIIGNVKSTYKARLEEPLRKENILDNVHFLGGCNDVHERLKNYHVGLMCSKAEGFGRVTAEYMHAGLAVIASSGGANTELIQDGINGFIYEYSNTKQLIEKIVYCYKHRGDITRVALNGKARANEKFTKERNAEMIANYYEYVMNMR